MAVVGGSDEHCALHWSCEAARLEPYATSHKSRLERERNGAAFAL